MIKLSQFKFTKDVLLLAVCVAGTAAVAWWAWAAGPVEPRPALGSTPQSGTAQSLTGYPYGSVSPAGSGSSPASAGQAAGADSSSDSGNASGPILSPPVQPVTPPVYPNCYPIEGAQTDMVTCPPYNCGAIRYPCCQYMESPQGACGCGGRGTELLCASPL